MVRYSHLFQNFPQLIVIHTVKGFGIVTKAEIDVFFELSCFFDDPSDVGNLYMRVLSAKWCSRVGKCCKNPEKGEGKEARERKGFLELLF